MACLLKKHSDNMVLVRVMSSLPLTPQKRVWKVIAFLPCKVVITAMWLNIVRLLNQLGLALVKRKFSVVFTWLII